MRITSFENLTLDAERMAYAERYFQRHYRGPFCRDQGVEQILDVLRRYAPPGTWLDLGSGPSTLFWSLPLSGITCISCSDTYPEMLTVLQRFVQSDAVPECYLDVLKMLGRCEEHLMKMRQCIKEYLVIDALKAWHDIGVLGTYDLVTEFGCFGLAHSAESFASCIGYAKPAIRPGGLLIGANWIKSRAYVELCGNANDYLSSDLVAHSAASHDMLLLHNECVSIKGDADYDAVVVWAMRKPEQEVYQ